MKRRTFLSASGALLGTGLAGCSTPAPNANTAAATSAATPKAFEPAPGQWRTFEVTHRVDVMRNGGVARAWVPIPSLETTWQRGTQVRWNSNADLVERLTDRTDGAGLVMANFNDKIANPFVEVISVVQAQSRANDWHAASGAPLSSTERARWVAATELIPTDGIVRQKALEAIGEETSDIGRVRKIYDWTIANTYREPKTRGCGNGDIKTALETGNLGGKCADINAIFVGLCRAVGIPARDVYGIRVAPSAFGYKALGAGSSNITRAQHCRAEVHLFGHGWVAMDPADVGKVQREETSEWIKTVGNPLVAPVYAKLFGGWEGNWMAYNMAHDVPLPGARGPKLGFLMYPQVETAQGRADPYDPDQVKYTITAREIKGA